MLGARVLTSMLVVGSFAAACSQGSAPALGSDSADDAGRTAHTRTGSVAEGGTGPRRGEAAGAGARAPGTSREAAAAAAADGGAGEAIERSDASGSGSAAPGPSDAEAETAAADGGEAAGGAGSTSNSPPDGCMTRLTYGSAWIAPADHPSRYDDVPGIVTWDGACSLDSAGNSVASLSNGWRPVFEGAAGCVIALDVMGDCAPAASCATRASYGPSWSAPRDHPNRFDDVDGVLTMDGVCRSSGDASYMVLSNGWQPHYTGSGGCALALRYTQCGGLFSNPVVATDCPDPGVLQEADRYVMVCTPGPAFPIRTSGDLVHWDARGTIFSDATRPRWAAGDFWAPEIHKLGERYVVYYSARHLDGDLAIGAASSDNALGPYEDLGEALLRSANPGVIDAHQFQAPDGARYLLWKVDGNANNTPSAIQIQRLREDGLALTGAASELLRNTLPWEGSVIEGPWMIYEAGYYYLFYSGNNYASSAYALGVARSTSASGGFTKAQTPILTSSGDWAGPGHGSVVRSPRGEWIQIFHAWPAAHIGQNPPGRQVFVARIGWDSEWPTMHAALSSHSQPVF